MIRLLSIFASVLLLASCQSGEEQPGDEPSGDQSRMVATGEMCGGIAGIGCASEGDYCAMEEGMCRMPDASGTCEARPEMCTQQYEPVCGCDGETYGNACMAASAGVNVVSTGECPA